MVHAYSLPPMHLDPDSLERLVPDELTSDGVTASETLRLHLERYEFAARHARPHRILDLACGAGYGTRLLADRTRHEVVGVDLSPAAIEYARRRYGRPGIEFVSGDAQTFEAHDQFDTVVSLETIEHVVDPVGMIEKLIDAVRVGGVLIASVPTTPSKDVNPHHLTDFTERSFRALVERPTLVEQDCLRQIQPFSPFAVAIRSEPRMADMRRDLARYYAAHPRVALRRIAATLRFGFSNRYATFVWRRVR